MMAKRGPEGQGKWNGPYARFRRCGKCSTCKASPDEKPHGPYWYMMRRNPSTGKHESLYFGVKRPSQSVVIWLNNEWTGPERPSKEILRNMMDNKSRLEQALASYIQAENDFADNDSIVGAVVTDIKRKSAKKSLVDALNEKMADVVDKMNE